LHTCIIFNNLVLISLFIHFYLQLICMKTLLLLACSVVFCSSAQKIFVSEIHYDGPGTDTSEFVEITGLAQNPLDCYQLFYVNGDTKAQVYTTYSLKGRTVLNEKNGYGALILDNNKSNQIQNGPKDGFLLYDSCLKRTVQYLSYEGVIEALAPYTDSSSRDIGLSESATPDSLSLQLQGELNKTNNTAWISGKSSPGHLNNPLAATGDQLGTVSGNIFTTTHQCADNDAPIASLTLLSAGKDGKLNTADDDFFSIPTSPEGRFLFRNILADSYLLQVNPPAGYKVLDDNPTKLLVAKNADSYFSFCLEPIATTVVDHSSGSITVHHDQGLFTLASQDPIHQVTLYNLSGQCEVH
jgi:hypothetical protein